MLTFFALFLALASLAASLALAGRLRVLNERLAMLEGEPKRVPLERRKEEPWGRGFANPLAGLRVSLTIQQDHPHPVFASLLKETLLKEEAIVDDNHPDLWIEGEIVGNGYADVYFRAEIAVSTGRESILTVSDKPPHGDRPANLAADIVRKLRDELDKREHRLAVRELHEPG